MQPTVKTTVVSGEAKMLADLKNLASLQVLVGIPESATARPKGSGVTNAELTFLHTQGVRASSMRRRVQATMNKGMDFYRATALYLHSMGSPLMQIPPRPIIEPAITATGNKEAILEELKKAGQAVLDGKKPEALLYLNRAGQTAVNFVRAWFTDPRNNWAPNAPSTIKAKGSDRPLIDTGELRKAMTYVVQDGGK